MQSAATASAGAKAESLEEQRMATEEDRFNQGMKIKRAEMGMKKDQMDQSNQQWWTARADGLKQLDKKQFDKFANGMLDRAGKSSMAKQVMHSLW